MHVQRLILGFPLLMLVGCQTIGGESMPTLTRTGAVKDVIIRDAVDPTSVMVNPGDDSLDHQASRRCPSGVFESHDRKPDMPAQFWRTDGILNKAQ